MCLIVSWNVAGWSTTIHRIDHLYKPENATLVLSQEDTNDNHGGFGTATTAKPKQKKLHPAASLKHFVELHQADILCLQEHKIQKQQLSNRLEPCQASNIPGFESFWSCCVDKNQKGLNGVVTYAPTGSVIAATASPLGSPDLDNQGRCVMTDHGTFCIFNVYVPNSAGHPLSFKMMFLNALRTAMQKQRARNKAVILVGDLNISHKAKDIYWKDRFVHVNDVLNEVAATSQTNLQNISRWKLDVAEHWNTINSIMATKEVVNTKTNNSLTNESYNKHRLCVTMPDGRKVFLGNHEMTPDYCRYGYDFSADTYVDPETGERVLCREDNVVCVSILAELMSKLVGVTWNESLQREIARSHASVPRLSPPRAWLTRLLSQDGMCDTFRHFYPEAEGRFTCWHQFTNKRYTNEGSRIDYCIVDQALMPHVRKGPGLRCGGSDGVEDQDKALSEEAALRAATANGQFKPVSFGGEGIQTASRATLETQFGQPHTGMIYTPPNFSDHIAISLLLADESNLLNRSYSLGTDPATRKAQPHKAQKTIASFFGATSSDGASSQSTNGADKKRPLTSLASKMATKQASNKKTLKKSSIMFHFQKQKM